MAKKLFVVFATIGFFLFLKPFPSMAQDISVAGTSARMQSMELATFKVQDPTRYGLQKLAIKNVLERYHSPLVNSVDSFMQTAITYNLNPYLLPSIHGLESTFGEAIIPGSYNGTGWGGGTIFFPSWNAEIQTVGAGLRNNYINKGATTVDEIGVIYSESPTWAVRVKLFMNQFEQEEAKNRLLFAPDGVQL